MLIKKLNLQVLLNDSLETFYWIGFILADGYFVLDKNKYIKFGIELANKDKQHLLNFLHYINCDSSSLKQRKIRNNNLSVNFSNKNLIPLIMKKYDLNFHKSYNPPNVELYTKFTFNQLFSLIIGFIDGDASIITEKDCNSTRLSFENHISYIKFFEFIQEFILNNFGKHIKCKNNYIRINNRGYVCMCFAKKELLQLIKEKVFELNLPVLTRKWNNILMPNSHQVAI